MDVLRTTCIEQELQATGRPLTPPGDHSRRRESMEPGASSSRRRRAAESMAEICFITLSRCISSELTQYPDNNISAADAATMWTPTLAACAFAFE